jgi:excisionase family DNA binding protein
MTVIESTPTALESARLLGVKQVASLLSISVRSTWRLVSSGKLPSPIRIGDGRLTRWRLSDLQAFVATGGDANE